LRVNSLALVAKRGSKYIFQAEDFVREKKGNRGSLKEDGKLRTVA
jgi:hypothetical protein